MYLKPMLVIRSYPRLEDRWHLHNQERVRYTLTYEGSSGESAPSMDLETMLVTRSCSRLEDQWDLHKRGTQALTYEGSSAKLVLSRL